MKFLSIPAHLPNRMGFGHKILCLAASLLGICSPLLDAQTTLAKWTFETSIPLTAGPLTPEEGAGSATSNTGGTFTNPAGWGSSESWSSSGWALGEYFQFQTSSTGSSGIIVSWQQVGSNTGPKNFRLEYSTDGTNFTNHATYLVNLSTWNSTLTPAADQYSYDLSAVSSLNNAATIYFRLTVVDNVAINNTTVAAAGSGRVDNFTIATAPPAGTPTITVNPSLPAFAAFSGFESASQSFVVTGANLTAPINLAAPTGFLVSSDNLAFNTSATLPATGGTGYARVAATAPIGPLTGSVTLSSTGATDKTIGLTATVSDPNVLTLSFLPTSIPEDSVTPAVGTISIPVIRGADLEVTLLSANTAAATVPATATITAGQLSTTFNATPVAAPSSFVTNSSLITASAAGLTGGSATLQVTNVDTPPLVSVSLTSSPSTQDFNSLGIAAFSGVVSPSIGAQTSLGAFAGTSLNGWYVTKIAGDGTVSTSITPDNGTLINGLVNNYGATADADRALGLIASGSNTMAMGALITNNTGGPLMGLRLSMTAEFWRSSTTTQNSLIFGYGKIADAITSSNFLSLIDTGVLPFAGLDIVGPTPVTTNGALDGNSVGNQLAFTDVTIPLALAPGESAFIRWQDTNDAGSDAGLAIDNLSITGVVQPPGSTFSSWIAGYDFSGFTNPDLTATGDPDNDGLDNAIENILGSSPAVASQGLTAVSSSAGNLVFRHTRNATPASDLQASYEWSTDLATWQASGVSAGGATVTFSDPVVQINPGPPALVEVTATVSGTLPGKVFARIKVQQN